MIYKVGIIGWGGMGHWHAKLISEQISRFKVKGVYDINPEKWADISQNGLIAYASVEELLKDEEIELVIIATPNNYHKDYAVKSLIAGKHVLCEKPAMMNSVELEEVISTAKKTGKIFTVHQNRRWDRDYLIIKELYEKNTIGKPFFIESRVNGARGIPGDWRCCSEAGGGMMLDWGVHLIDQLLYMIDSSVVEVYAQILKLKYNQVDDNFKMMLRFENGINALIEVGTFHFINQPRWYMNCEAGTALIRDWGSGADVVIETDTEIDWEMGIVYTAAGPTKTMAGRPKNTTEEFHIDIAPKCSNQMLHELLADAIEHNDPDKVAVLPNEIMRSMKVMEAAFKSSNDGIVVKERI